MFEKLSAHILQSQWMKEFIKTPPPINVTDDQRKQAQQKIKLFQLSKPSKPSKLNLS